MPKTMPKTMTDTIATPADNQHATPRVSVLVPNFNNGRQSSTGHRYDLLGDLLRSLFDTLADDPTPLEIIACDDGSTDDSLDTLRAWSQRRWPDDADPSRVGQPVLRLIEAEHCGVLSVVANRLVAESRGDILVRLDGDIVVHTPRWASTLVDCFDHPPLAQLPAGQLGVVGPLQLGIDGTVHSFGDAILHPRGYHHHAAGLAADAITEAREVDHVMGCFYCCRREVFDRLDGFDEAILRGQTIDFGLRSRAAGYRCLATPAIRFTHRHSLRERRATAADQRDGIRQTQQRFRDKWGFDRIAPDIAEVLRRHEHNAALLWERERFARPWPIDATGDSSELVKSAWARYTDNHRVRQTVDGQLQAIAQLFAETRHVHRIAIVGCGSGLIVHLAAQAVAKLRERPISQPSHHTPARDVELVGIDSHAGCIALAQRCTARQEYLDAHVAFEHQRYPDALPFADGELDALVFIHQLERHPNPIRLLRDARRATRDGGYLLAIARNLGELSDDDRLGPAADTAFDSLNLRALIQAEDNWKVATSPLPSANQNKPIVLGAVRGEGLAKATASPIATESVATHKPAA